MISVCIPPCGSIHWPFGYIGVVQLSSIWLSWTYGSSWRYSHRCIALQLNFMSFKQKIQDVWCILTQSFHSLSFIIIRLTACKSPDARFGGNIGGRNVLILYPDAPWGWPWGRQWLVFVLSLAHLDFNLGFHTLLLLYDISPYPINWN